MSTIQRSGFALLFLALLLFSGANADAASAPGTIETIAGGAAGDGGSATNATLREPHAIAVSAAGDLYILDSSRCRIRGVVEGIITNVAGTGICATSADGSAAATSPVAPSDMEMGPDGSLYFTEALPEGPVSCRVRRIVAGLLTTVAGNGNCGAPTEGAAATGTAVAYPTMLAVDGAGAVYVAGLSDCRVWKFAAGVVTRVAGGRACGVQFDADPRVALITPVAIAIDASGSNLYIAENDFFQACRIRRVAGGVMSLFAGEGRCGGSPDGTPPLTARIHPLDIAVGSTGDVFIAGFCTVRRISGGILGTSATCDPAAPGSPPYRADLFPEVLTVRGSGDVWLADFQTCRVMHVGAASVPVVAGNGYCGFFGGDGAPAVYATLNSPRGVAVDDAGTVYIADTSNCRIRKVVGGVITTIAGNACGTGTLPLPAVGVAIPATYGAVLPVSIAATSAGDIYLLDENACRLRKVSGGAITTLAGGSICGWSISDGMAAAASQFPGVAGVAVASDETVYVSAACQIWSIALGVVHLVAGTGSCTSSGDGGAATSAGLNVPLGLAYHNGDLYIAERGACRIRLVRAGIITTVAGHPSGTLCGFGGDGGSATDGLLDQPTNVALDAAGTLYIGDKGNCRVRKVKAAKISTFAGNGICGFGGDGGLASMASLDSLAALRVLAVTADTFGEVYIADEGNDRIRAVRPAALCAAVMRADVNGDAKVNILDLSTIAHHYGELIPPAPARYDQNADGKINIFDLSIPAGVYGKTLAAACP